MRYTTIIDISQIDEVWQNKAARDIYIYMVLKSGYHSDDLDIIKSSQYMLTEKLNLSRASVRYALALLERANLIKRLPGSKHNVTSAYKVRKYIEPEFGSRKAPIFNAKVTKQEENLKAVAEEREKKEIEAANRSMFENEMKKREENIAKLAGFTSPRQMMLAKYQRIVSGEIAATADEIEVAKSALARERRAELEAKRLETAANWKPLNK